MMTIFDPSKIRTDFPLLAENSLHYLDNAATTQKPQSVIDAIVEHYSRFNANVHRGVYRLSEEATEHYEGVRKKVAAFLGASVREIVFTSGTTDGINLVAMSLWASGMLKSDDTILVSVLEHHSNLVPWQMLAKRTGAQLRFLPVGDDYRIDLDRASKYFDNSVKVLACGHVSNVTGGINPIMPLIQMAKDVNAITVIDGAQGVAHLDADVAKLGCDFYAFSGHKALGPTGSGALFGREELLMSMEPAKGGGDMIRSVTQTRSEWNDIPIKFEPGTPSIAQVIGLGAAIDYLARLDRKAVLEHERALGRRLIADLKARPGVRVFSPEDQDWVGIVSFVHDRIHPHDMAAVMDNHHVAIRAGHHCAQPLMEHWGVAATSRVSPYLYNTEDDIDVFLQGLDAAESLFQ